MPVSNKKLRARYATDANFRNRRKATCKKWAARNREKMLAYYRNRYYRISTPATRRQHHLKVKYGISPAQVDALILLQRGKCALCCRKRRLVVDHNHTSGKVRGMLCYRCNILLGQIEAKCLSLERIAQYLTQAASK